jgi:secreted trypsin-like serine protease
MVLLLNAVSITNAQGPDIVGVPTIVGGEDAGVGEFPWQALVLPGGFQCGGSLITTEWVLTAAHCLFDQSGNPITADQIQIYMGVHDQQDLGDSAVQQFSVIERVPHPSYSPNGNDNDIALLKLSSAATLNSRVQVVSLVTDADGALVAAGTDATVSGWGATSEGGNTADILQKVVLPIVSNATCEGAVGGITENMLCAGVVAGGMDSCQGDSGGPLVVSDGGSGWKQGGVVSFGVGCARPGQYGVYARVSQYITWITSHTGTTMPPTNTDNQVVVTATASVNILGANKLYLPIVLK